MYKTLPPATAAGALVFAGAMAQADPRQGGEMVVTCKDDISTFTTELMPDLAESYTVSDDRITFEVGQEPQVALLRLKRGEVDGLGDPIHIPAHHEYVHATYVA